MKQAGSPAANELACRSASAGPKIGQPVVASPNRRSHPTRILPLALLDAMTCSTALVVGIKRTLRPTATHCRARLAHQAARQLCRIQGATSSSPGPACVDQRSTQAAAWWAYQSQRQISHVVGCCSGPPEAMTSFNCVTASAASKNAPWNSDKVAFDICWKALRSIGNISNSMRQIARTHQNGYRGVRQLPACRQDITEDLSHTKMVVKQMDASS